ncbi:MAG: autotransporter assembly complex protein TamA [Pseudomonadales bacterium]
MALLVCALLVAASARSELTIRGVNDDVEAVLRAFVTIDELPCDAPRWWVERRHRQAPEQIRRGLEALGYYRSEVSGELEWQEQCWQASYRVEPGEPVRIQTVDLVLEGDLAEEPRVRDVIAGLDVAPEEVFSHQSYENAKSALLEVAQGLGYFDAEFIRHRVEVNPQTNVADIELTLVSGPRYRVGAIELQQRVLEPKLFQRFLQFEEGDHYDEESLAETYRNLIGSDYFDRVLVAPDLDARADGLVPVQVTASATIRRSVLVGGGYATDTGPRTRLDLRYRYLNDRGHRANFNSLLSTTAGRAQAEYRLPYGDPTHEWLFAKADVNYEETDTFERLQRGVTVGRTLRRGRAWAETNYLEYSVEDFEVGEQEGTSQLLLLGTNWARTTSINAPRPLQGYSLSFDVRGAGRMLLSDNDLLQMIVRGRQIVPLGDRFRLLARAHAGWTWQREFADLPPSVRFFAGGDNSVRGYGFESIGPEKDGSVVGGQRLLTGSLELDAAIRPNWSVAVFADSGSAFNGSPEFSTGVGVGVRWYSPLGPLRFDVAHPLDDPDNRVRLHISLGPDL